MPTSSTARRAAFRAKVEERQGLLVPGAFNAMSARVIEDAGFEAISWFGLMAPAGTPAPIISKAYQQAAKIALDRGIKYGLRATGTAAGAMIGGPAGAAMGLTAGQILAVGANRAMQVA